MNLPSEEGDWMMGGSADAEANEAMGFSEVEVAQLAVSAYEYAWSKVRGGQGNGMRARAVHELTEELACQLREHLGLEPPED